jgi:putative spermidine/putrescine transport system ATP-binding protein
MQDPPSATGMTMPTPPALPLVRFRDVRKSYDGLAPAVGDLSLDVAEGEFLTLLGPSGSGKTTTLMMLAGFERPDSGEILLEGRSIARTPPHRRGIGVVFQSYALFPHMNVAENVAFPLRMRGIGKAERQERVAAALDRVRLTQLAARMPSQLSGGQQQRVALARALVFAPRLVLLDEPLGALDRQLREEMQLEIRRLHRELGVTMLYVTHDQAEALALSDRIAVLEGGRLRQLGTPEDLYENPADAFVARFVGENNRLPGTVEEVEDDIARIRLDCGPVVEAQVADAHAGKPCMVSIRPERVAVAAVPAEEMGGDALPATVLERTYHGDHVRLRLLVGEPGFGLAEVVVQRPAGVPLSGLVPGETASIAWQAYHARAFAPEDGA